MARFLIEIPHAEEIAECARIVQVFLSSGSHLLTNGEWGCMDGVHTAWIIVDVDSKADALAIVPPALRAATKVIALNQFTLEGVNAVIERLEAEKAGSS